MGPDSCMKFCFWDCNAESTRERICSKPGCCHLILHQIWVSSLSYPTPPAVHQQGRMSLLLGKGEGASSPQDRPQHHCCSLQTWPKLCCYSWALGFFHSQSLNLQGKRARVPLVMSGHTEQLWGSFCGFSWLEKVFLGKKSWKGNKSGPWI